MACTEFIVCTAGAIDVETLKRCLGAVAQRHGLLFALGEGGTESGGGDGNPAGALCLVAKPLDGERDLDVRRRLLAMAEAVAEAGPVAPNVTIAVCSGQNQSYLAAVARPDFAACVPVASFLLDVIAAYGIHASDPQVCLSPDCVVEASAGSCDPRVVDPEETARYWRLQLLDAQPSIGIPSDSAKPMEPTCHDNTCQVQLSASLTRALREHAAEAGLDLRTVLLSAYLVLLDRYSLEDDLVVGVLSRRGPSGAGEAAFVPAPGMLPIRWRVDGSATAGAFMAEVDARLAQGERHAGAPLWPAVEQLSRELGMTGTPLFQAAFSLQAEPPREIHCGGLTWSFSESDSPCSPYAVSLELLEQGDHVHGALVYNTGLLDAKTAGGMVRQWHALLEQMVADNRVPVGSLNLATPDERQALLSRAHVVQSLPVEAPLHVLFSRKVDTHSGHVAVCMDGSSLTYRALNAQANQTANYLRKAGVQPGSLVGVLLERSIALAPAVLGILKTGGAYVPIDPSYPKERVAGIIEDARCGLVLTQSSLRDHLPARAALRVVDIDLDGEDIFSEDTADPDVPVRPEDLAYVIFTSGSTGRPKGVMVTHANVVRLFTSTEAWFHFSDMDVWTLFHSMAFDFSVWEFWGALLHGGRLVIVPYLVSRSPADFHELLLREGVTVLNQTPSAFYQLMHHGSVQGTSNVDRFALRLVIFGGEALDLPSLAPWFGRHGDKTPQLVNMYGITETTVHVTYRPLTEDDAQPGRTSRIGRPIPDLKLLILDTYGNLVPDGVPGELYVGGAGVAKGYLNRPDLTAERFISNPFSGDGERLYRTGDLVRRTQDGDMEYLGRIDQQVQVRGFRVELGEVEAVLKRHPHVRDAVVVFDQASVGEGRILAYWLGRHAEGSPEFTSRELRSFLGDVLPGYMVPSWFGELDAFPLTPNGKLDRKALPEPETMSSVASHATDAPETEMEQELAQLWSSLLPVSGIGRGDSFFDLGGHSLLATQMISRIRDAYGVELPLRAVFEAPTLKDLAERIQSLGDGAREDVVGSIRPSPRDGSIPLSLAQERLWFLAKLAPGSTAYNVAFQVHFRGKLDPLALQAAVNSVVFRHEALRTTFEEEQGTPVQRITNPTDQTLEVVDLSGLSPSERASECQRVAEHEARFAFDLSTPPLFRAKLLRLSDTEHTLCVVVHHIVFDGWSLDVFHRDLTQAYADALDSEIAPRLPGLPLQYADFAQWQVKQFGAERRARELGFWRAMLPGELRPLDLDTDHPRPSVQTFRGACVCGAVPEETTRTLVALARARGVTVFAVLAAAWQGLLHRYTGQEEILLSTAISDRGHAELEPLVGFFVNTVAMPTDFRGDPGLMDIARQIHRGMLEIQEHQIIPFDELLAELSPGRGVGASPLFQTMFVLQNTPDSPQMAGGLSSRIERLHNGGAKFDLTLDATERNGQIALEFEYNSDLFEEATIAQMLSVFQTLLRGSLEHPDEPLATHPLVGPSERERLLESLSGTESPYERDCTIAELFERQVALRPEATALVCGSRSLSYRALNEHANRLAAILRGRGVCPDQLVGLFLGRSLEMVVAILGILKAGGAYLPLDMDYPVARLRLMLDDSRASLILASRDLLGRVPASNAEVLCVDLASEDLAEESAENHPHASKADNLAYVMYTSGSTGVPKGVCVEQRGVVRLVRNTNYIRIGSDDVFLLLAPVSFDASTFEIWAPLLNGGKLIVAPAGPLSLRQMGQLIRREEVTTLWLTAGLFHQMVDHELESLRGLRHLLSGGDVLSVPHVRRALSVLSDTVIINGYGPTESTTFACCHPMRDDASIRATVPIGRPVANTRVYILDRNGQPVPAGMRGELHIGGDGLARGYLNDPAMTAGKFVPDPFSRDRDARIYRTGDLARYLPSGDIEFLGRMDGQVKLRGFRIELGEIEAVLAQHARVAQAAVVLRDDGPAGKRLAAFVVGHAGDMPSAKALRDHLQQTLPAHMVPADIVLSDALPLTTNGKVDRSVLRSKPIVRERAETGFVHPRRGTEQAIHDVWADLLGLAEVSVQDSFFELGGSSLLALRAVTRIEAKLECTISIRDFLEHPTIEQLAEYIDIVDSWKDSYGHVESDGAEGMNDGLPCATLLKPGSGRPVVFLVEGGGSATRVYGSLAARLDTEAPVYGLDYLDVTEETYASLSVRALAERYISALRSSAPTGPYVLGGWSFGGTIAYEMAQQLLKQGVEVPLLVLLDVHAASPETLLDLAKDSLTRTLRFGALLVASTSKLPTCLVGAVQVVRDTGRDGVDAGRKLHALSSYLKFLRSWLRTKHTNKRDGLPVDESLSALLEEFRDRFSKSVRGRLRTNIRLSDGMKYRPYPGRVLLVRPARGYSFAAMKDEALGWAALAEGRVEVRRTPGSHLTLLNLEFVGEVAAAVSEGLARTPTK